MPYLIKSGLVVPKELNLVLPPYPLGFGAYVRCEFHAGAPGHSFEDCKALKSGVYDLIDSKAISFTPQWPNIDNNTLPSHAGPSVNDVKEVNENRC